MNANDPVFIAQLAAYYREHGGWNVILCGKCKKIIDWDRGEKGKPIDGPSISNGMDCHCMNRETK